MEGVVYPVSLGVDFDSGALYAFVDWVGDQDDVYEIEKKETIIFKPAPTSWFGVNHLGVNPLGFY